MSHLQQSCTAWDLIDLLHVTRPRALTTAPSARINAAHAAAIVEWVFLHRIATASQIARKFPNWLTSERTTRRRLSDYVRHGYLTVVPTRAVGPIFPQTYAATARGLRLVGATYEQLGYVGKGRLADEQKARGRTAQTLLHELLLTEVQLGLALTIEALPDLRLLESERRYFRPDLQLQYRTEAGHIRRLSPDAGILLSHGGADAHYEQLYIELDNGTMSAGRMQQKWLAYEHWLTAPQQLSLIPGRRHVATRVLVVAHDLLRPKGDERRLALLLAAAATLGRRARERFWFSTATWLRDHQHKSAPLAGPLWVRARDLRRTFAHVQSPEAPFRNQRQLQAEQRRHFRDALKEAPRHQLFPGRATRV